MGLRFSKHNCTNLNDMVMVDSNTSRLQITKQYQVLQTGTSG